MVSHGVITGALFLLVGVIYERTHDRTIAKMGGLPAVTPVYAAMFGFFMFASAGLPGLSGFVGEFLVFLGVWSSTRGSPRSPLRDDPGGRLPALDVPAACSAARSPTSSRASATTSRTSSPIEVLTLVPLGTLVVVFGLFPGLILESHRRSRGHGPGGIPGRAVDGHHPASPAVAEPPNDRCSGPTSSPSRHSSGRSSSRARSSWSTSSGPTARRPAIVVALVGAGGGRRHSRSSPGRPPRTPSAGPTCVDALTTFLDLLFIAIVALTVLFAPDYLEPRGLPIAEFAATLLFAITGAMLISAPADLLVLFVGLELMVLPGYMLAGFAKRDGLSTEGAIKYFLLGSFSRDLPVRPGVRVGPHRHDQHRRRSRAALAAIVAGAAPLSAGPGHGPRAS